MVSFTGIYLDLDCSKDPSLDIDDWAKGNDHVIKADKQWSDNAVRTFLEETLRGITMGFWDQYKNSIHLPRRVKKREVVARYATELEKEFAGEVEKEGLIKKKIQSDLTDLSICDVLDSYACKFQKWIENVINKILCINKSRMSND